MTKENVYNSWFISVLNDNTENFQPVYFYSKTLKLLSQVFFNPIAKSKPEDKNNRNQCNKFDQFFLLIWRTAKEQKSLSNIRINWSKT